MVLVVYQSNATAYIVKLIINQISHFCIQLSVRAQMFNFPYIYTYIMSLKYTSIGNESMSEVRTRSYRQFLERLSSLARKSCVELFYLQFPFQNYSWLICRVPCLLDFGCMKQASALYAFISLQEVEKEMKSIETLTQLKYYLGHASLEVFHLIFRERFLIMST